MPKLKGVTFETAIIERYRRRESSVEEALIEMYLAGVSVRRVEDISEVLWGSKVSASTISELNKKAYVHPKERSSLNRQPTQNAEFSTRVSTRNALLMRLKPPAIRTGIFLMRQSMRVMCTTAWWSMRCTKG